MALGRTKTKTSMTVCMREMKLQVKQMFLMLNLDRLLNVTRQI